MFKNFEIGELPITMTVTAQAVWNEFKDVWEVSVMQSETNVDISGKYFFSQSVHDVKVKDCNEFILADAILHANGVNLKKLYNSDKSPIVGK